MSKYVRTKDGVYEVKENCLGFYVVVFEKVSTEAISNEYIIKEADTIEELVDIYVVDCEYFKNEILNKWNGHKIVIDWFNNVTYVLKDLPKHFTNIRCGIFTDTGIIYVGDMNKEGEIKLR